MDERATVVAAFARRETDYEAGDNAVIETLKWEPRAECEDRV